MHPVEREYDLVANADKKVDWQPSTPPHTVESSKS